MCPLSHSHTHSPSLFWQTSKVWLTTQPGLNSQAATGVGEIALLEDSAQFKTTVLLTEHAIC